MVLASVAPSPVERPEVQNQIPLINKLFAEMLQAKQVCSLYVIFWVNTHTHTKTHLIVDSADMEWCVPAGVLGVHVCSIEQQVFQVLDTVMTTCLQREPNTVMPSTICQSYHGLVSEGTPVDCWKTRLCASHKKKKKSEVFCTSTKLRKWMAHTVCLNRQQQVGVRLAIKLIRTSASCIDAPMFYTSYFSSCSLPDKPQILHMVQPITWPGGPPSSPAHQSPPRCCDRAAESRHTVLRASRCCWHSGAGLSAPGHPYSWARLQDPARSVEKNIPHVFNLTLQSMQSTWLSMVIYCTNSDKKASFCGFIETCPIPCMKALPKIYKYF